MDRSRSNMRRMSVILWVSCTISVMQLTVAQTPAPARFQWQLITPSTAAAPTPRSGGALVYAPLAKQLVMYGGSGNTDVWTFDLATNVWTQVPINNQSPAPSQRSGFSWGLYTMPAAGATGAAREVLMVAHGTRSGHEVNSEVWGFFLDTRTWAQFQLNGGSEPQGRYGQAFGLYPGTNWFFMSHGFGKSHRLSDTHAFNLSGSAWTQIWKGNDEYTPTKPHPRCLVGSTMATPQRMVLYGGCLQGGFVGGPCPARDAWIIDVSGGGTDIGTAPHSPSWRRVKDGPSPRTYSGLARLPTSMGLGTGLVLVYGGIEQTRQTISVDKGSDRDIDILDTNTKTWLLTPAVGDVPAFRSSPALTTSEEESVIYLFGGLLRDGGANTNDLWRLTRVGGAAAPASLPPARAGASEWFMYIHLHGLFMSLSWGLTLPAGVFIARNLRHKDPLWFKLHRAIQATGTLFSIIGFILVFVGGANNPAFAHGIIGILVFLLGFLQPINAYFRPHKGERRRDAWEWLHKGSGYTAVLLGVINVSLGMYLVMAPTGVIIAWFVVLGLMTFAVVGTEGWRFWTLYKHGPAAGMSKGNVELQEASPEDPQLPLAKTASGFGNKAV